MRAGSPIERLRGSCWIARPRVMGSIWWLGHLLYAALSVNRGPGLAVAGLIPSITVYNTSLYHMMLHAVPEWQHGTWIRHWSYHLSQWWVFLEEIGCGAAECDGVYPNQHIDGLVQERPNSIASALELRLSCIGPSIYSRYGFKDCVMGPT